MIILKNQLLIQEFIKTHPDRIEAEPPRVNNNYGHSYIGIDELNDKYFDLLSCGESMFFKVDNSLIQYSDQSRKNRLGFYLPMKSMDSLVKFIEHIESEQDHYQKILNEAVKVRITNSLMSSKGEDGKDFEGFIIEFSDDIITIDELYNVSKDRINEFINKIEFNDNKSTYYRVDDYWITASNCGRVTIQFDLTKLI